jgi:hypothetical protein
MSALGHSLPIHLAPFPANVRYYPNSDRSRCFATHSARKRVITAAVIPQSPHDIAAVIRRYPPMVLPFHTGQGDKVSAKSAAKAFYLVTLIRHCQWAHVLN